MSFKFYVTLEEILTHKEKYNFDTFTRPGDSPYEIFLYPTDKSQSYWEIGLAQNRSAVFFLYSKDLRDINKLPAKEIGWSRQLSYYKTKNERIFEGGLDDLLTSDLISKDFKSFIIFNIDLFSGTIK